jgi:small subunit ribosomal protein S2
MKSLLEAGVHFGHQTHRWNPKMARYIFGSRNNIHIIDLQKTVRELKKAFNFVKETAAANKSVLFVGTKKQAQETVVQEAQRCAQPFVSERWLGGTLTNFETIRRSSQRLQDLQNMKEKGVFDLLSKKERARREKDIKRLSKSLAGIKDMTELPGCLFLIDPASETTTVLEGRKVGIPIVAVCDTNSDPDMIDYPIPGNDDAIRAIRLITSIVADAVIQGRETLAQGGSDDSKDAGQSETSDAKGSAPTSSDENDSSSSAEPSLESTSANAK